MCLQLTAYNPSISVGSGAISRDKRTELWETWTNCDPEFSPAKLPWHSGRIAEKQEPQDGIKLGLCVVEGQRYQQRDVMHPSQRVHAPPEAQLLCHLHSQVLHSCERYLGMSCMLLEGLLRDARHTGLPHMHMRGVRRGLRRTSAGKHRLQMRMKSEMSCCLP